MLQSVNVCCENVLGLQLFYNKEVLTDPFCIVFQSSHLNLRSQYCYANSLVIEVACLETAELCTMNFGLFRLDELLDFISFPVAFITNGFSAIFPVFTTIAMLLDGEKHIGGSCWLKLSFVQSFLPEVIFSCQLASLYSLVD